MQLHLADGPVERSSVVFATRSIPDTFRADIDYSLSEAHTTYGRLGIKVWICKGEIYGKRDLSPNIGMNASTGNKQQGGGDGKHNPKFNKSNKRGNK